jgi:oligoendopeptidase F
MAKIKNFNSSIEASLYSDNIDVSVYNKLIETVNKNLPVLYKYYDLKKEMLKLDELHLYDIYTPLVSNNDKKYSFKEAKETVLSALSILGDDYINNLNKAFDERWIDIYNNKGKRGGAYSSGFYDTKPYLLLNFEGKYEDVTTLAHELGHSMHTYYSCHNH